MYDMYIYVHVCIECRCGAVVIRSHTDHEIRSSNPGGSTGYFNYCETLEALEQHMKTDKGNFQDFTYAALFKPLMSNYLYGGP